MGGGGVKDTRVKLTAGSCAFFLSLQILPRGRLACGSSEAAVGARVVKRKHMRALIDTGWMGRGG